MDKRIIKTRRALGDALIQLLRERAFHQITIRQVTEAAGLAYSTFFRNFESIEALLHAHTEEFLHGIDIFHNDSPDDSFRETSRKRVFTVFQHVTENQRLYQILLNTSAVRPILDAFKQELIDGTLEMLSRFEAELREDSPPTALAVHHTSAQLFAMIEWWLAQDTAIDAETLSHYYEQLVTFPTWRLLFGNSKAHDLLGIPLPK